MDGSKWAIAAAGIVVPVAAVLLSLPLQHGFWVLLALAGGVALSVTLVEVAARDDTAREAAPLDSEPPEVGDRHAGDDQAVALLDVYGKRVDGLPHAERVPRHSR